MVPAAAGSERHRGLQRQAAQATAPAEQSPRSAAPTRAGRSPAARRLGEDALAELRDELSLDLALRVAGGDPPADELLHAQARPASSTVERRVARRADELALELGLCRMLLARERGGNDGEREHGASARTASRQRLPDRRRRARSSVISPTLWSMIVPFASTKNVSGSPVIAPGLPELRRAVVGDQVSEPVLLDEFLASLVKSCASTPRTTTRPSCRFCHAARAAALPCGTGRTTSPRS